MKRKILNKIQEIRTKRARARIFGTAARPRLSVSRSNQYMYAQLIDDEKGHTLVNVSLKDVVKPAEKFTKTELAKHVGELIAKKAIEKGIQSVVFDRRGHNYHGRVKAVAEGARSSGLKL